jgi:hypothetical protein
MPKVRKTGFELRAMSCEPRAVGYELRAMSYGDFKKEICFRHKGRDRCHSNREVKIASIYSFSVIPSEARNKCSSLVFNTEQRGILEFRNN